jgi:conjugative transfer region protein TrbK
MIPAAKIALGAALAGLMLTLAVVSAQRPPVPVSSMVSASKMPGPLPTADMTRCRAATMPDTECEAAWAARRRHFFGEETVTPDGWRTPP